MADHTDAANVQNESDNETDQGVTSPDPMESDVYNLNRSGRLGIALIFNHLKFDDRSMKERSGTDKDAKDLKKTYEKLGLSVNVYNDLKYGDIYDILREASQIDHTDHSCLIITVMSHGEADVIYARDHTYQPDTLWMPFTGEKCPTLAGKPKFVFIQACRGDSVDNGVVLKRSLIQRDSVAVKNTYTIPSMADILVMYSTYDGYYSWRSPVSGSWFVQCLCAELEDSWRSRDLFTILTFVNRRMAIGYESNVPNNQKMDRKKQIGTIVSTLTRLFYFHPQ